MEIGEARRIATKIYVGLARVLKFPSFIQFEPSKKCNLQCEMCEYNKISGGKVMNFKEFKPIFKDIIKANPLSKIFPKIMLFDMTGIGEGLMNPDFLKILRYMKSKGVTITFATNATLLTKSNSKMLIENNIDIVFLSIDGATKKTYEKIRKGAKFDHIKKKIKEFSLLKRQLKKNKPKLMIRFLASSFNIEEMPLMVDLAEEIGVQGISITNMNTAPGEEYLKADKKRFDELVNIVKKKAKEKNIQLDVGFTKRRPITACKRALNSMYVSCEGFVLPCCFINQGGRYEEITKKYNFGNVNKINIKDIWNSQKYKKFRNQIRKGIAPPVCQGCYLFYPIKK